MSLLLDALKKSEAQRRRGQLPDMQTAAHDHASSRSGSRRGRRVALVAVPALVVLALAGGWLIWQRQAQQPAPALDGQAVDRSAGPAAGPAGNGPDQSRVQTAPAALPEPAPPSLADQAERVREAAPGAGSGATPEPVAERLPESMQAKADAGEPASAAPPAEPESNMPGGAGLTPVQGAAPSGQAESRLATTDAAGPAAPSPEPTSLAGSSAPADEPPPAPPAGKADAQPVANFIRPWELPQQLRSQFPALQMSVHFFSADPKQRFVLINAERRAEGDTVAEGVRLAEIVEQGAVVEFRGYRILLQ